MASAEYVIIDGQYYSKNCRRVLARSGNQPIVNDNETKNDAKPVGGSGHSERKRHPLPALDKGKKAHRSGKARVVVCVKIISHRRNRADLDNIIGGAKPLRDSIAKSLGIDDGDPRIKWEYDTITTTGATGTSIIISVL